MQIGSNKVVTIDYTLTDNEGTVIGTSKSEEPMSYIQGIGKLIPGLESALEGKSTGDTLLVSVAPEEGYGLRNDSLVQAVPRQAFQGIDTIEPGMQFQAQGGAGPMLVTVVEVGDTEVKIDGNHPLAGKSLIFSGVVTGVRAASAEELTHGHVHGEGGHHH